MTLPLHDLVVGARFLRDLPSFLRKPLSPGEAGATLARRLARRDEDLLEMAKHAIYAQQQSPYRQLLRQAGCEYGDLEQLVRGEGPEGALLELFRRGVYLTVDEFKGRSPIKRGSTSFAVSPRELQNPRTRVHLQVSTSGSGGLPTSVSIDLAYIRTRAVNTLLALEAYGGLDWSHAAWGVPGGATMMRVLEFASFDRTPVHWFSQLDDRAAGLHPRYRWSARLMRWASLLSGRALPRPEYTPLEDPTAIEAWMASVLQRGQSPHLLALVSSAVRLCEAASKRLDLHGVRLSISGEPITSASLEAIQKTGARAVPTYASTESGALGTGCLAPRGPDDLHLYHDLVAMIQPPVDGPGHGFPGQALLVSSLRPTAPFILLNVSLGDRAELTEPACGCPLERLGWTRHLHDVRSYEKLTAGGMTFFDTDVLRVLEQTLPSRFGGGPTDYQLLEEQTAAGHTQLRLLVHPRVGPLDEAAVADVFLSAIGGGSGVERVMELQWRQAGLLSVAREAPRVTSTGKILHLHTASSSADR
jgi:hypothetical protein